MSSLYLLDTNILIATLKGRGKIRRRLESEQLSAIRLSAIVLGELEFGAEKSAYGERNLVVVTSANPRARVVKAFNTTFASALVAGWVGGLPLDVFLAGDDARAKSRVAALVTDGGMRPVDTGPLRRAQVDFELDAIVRIDEPDHAAGIGKAVAIANRQYTRAPNGL